MTVTSIIVGCFYAVLIGSDSYANNVTDPKLGFTLKLSSDFTPRPDLVGTTPDIVHAFEYGEAAVDEIAVLLLIEKMGGLSIDSALRNKICRAIQM